MARTNRPGFPAGPGPLASASQHAVTFSQAAGETAELDAEIFESSQQNTIRAALRLGPFLAMEGPMGESASHASSMVSAFALAWLMQR